MSTEQKSYTAPGESIQIEVAFAEPRKQHIVRLAVGPMTTAEQAVESSKLKELFPEFDFDTASLGVFGKIVPRDHLLADNDRVEVYRDLIQSPTEARRKREARRRKKSVRVRS